MIQFLAFQTSNLFSLLVLLLLGSLAHAEAPITALAVAPDGKRVLVGSQKGVDVYAWPDLIAGATLPTELKHIHDLQFSPDGQFLLMAGGSPGLQGEVEIWSWPAAKRVRSILVHSDVVFRAVWSPDGRHWANSSIDGLCSVYSAETFERQVIYQGHSGPVLALGWLDSKTIVSAGADQTIRVWNSETATHTRTLDNHLKAVNALAMRPTPGEAASGLTREVLATVAEDRTVRLWQPRIGRLLRFTRLDTVPLSVGWSADGGRLFVGCSDGKLRIINWETMETLAVACPNTGRINELAWDARSQLVVVAGEKGCSKLSVEKEVSSPPSGGEAPF